MAQYIVFFKMRSALYRSKKIINTQYVKCLDLYRKIILLKIDFIRKYQIKLLRSFLKCFLVL